MSKKKEARSDRRRENAPAFGQQAQGEFIPLAAAATETDLSPRQIQRLVDEGKLEAVKRQGRVLVSRLGVNRMRLDRLIWDFATAPFLLPGDGGPMFGELPTIFVYSAVGTDPTERLPREDLRVRLLDLPRLMGAGAREELRSQIPGQPESFEVRFRLDAKEVDQTLWKIVQSLPPPPIYGEPRAVPLPDDRGFPERTPYSWAREIQAEAVEYLLDNLPALLVFEVKNPRAYLQAAVKNFFRDKVTEADRDRKAAKRAAREINRMNRDVTLREEQTDREEFQEREERLEATGGDLDVAGDLSAAGDPVGLQLGKWSEGPGEIQSHEKRPEDPEWPEEERPEELRIDARIKLQNLMLAAGIRPTRRATSEDERRSALMFLTSSDPSVTAERRRLCAEAQVSEAALRALAFRHTQTSPR